jgi:cbb3-type cytochrome oxidase maturation protein
VALPAAAFGFIGPWEAAIGMSASSFIVVLNALRPLAREGSWKQSLYLLIPLSVALVFLIGWVFWRALEGGQFDDLERPGTTC